jgi:hypothetical protein
MTTRAFAFLVSLIVVIGAAVHAPPAAAAPGDAAAPAKPDGTAPAGAAPAEAAPPEKPAISEAAAAKLFARAKDAFGRGKYVEAARLCWKFTSRTKPGAEKYESAQFFLAQSLEKLRFYHGAVEYYFQVANNRRTPELLPRTIRALEAIALSQPFDEGMIIRDLIGDTDFGDLPGDLSDFVYYWQGMTNLERGLGAWSSERFQKVGPRGYYYFTTLYVAAVRLLHPGKPEAKEEAVTSFAHLFGGLDLGAALEAMRRRGEGDSKMGYAVKALINEDNAVNVRYDKLPKGWPIHLAMLGLARVAAETEILLQRAKNTDEEALGLPLSYNVEIGGMPVYRRAIRFEERAPAIKAVASRYDSVRRINGKALHSLSRLLYEQRQFAGAYSTLGKIPKGTELSSEILLERAWSKYKAGNAHRAMGLLYALDAPVYRKLFAPEKYILRALIYRRFCHYRASKLAARKFRILHDEALRQIRAGVPLEEIDRVREPALRRVQSRKLFLFLRSLRWEREALKKWDDEWGPGGLYKHLRKLYRQKVRQIKAELKSSMEESTAEVAEEMLRAEEQVNLLEYEVGQAIFQRVSESAIAGVVRKKAAKVPISSERVYYIFGGEYWTDELPHYKFNIEDRCVD